MVIIPPRPPSAADRGSWVRHSRPSQHCSGATPACFWKVVLDRFLQAPASTALACMNDGARTRTGLSAIMTVGGAWVEVPTACSAGFAGPRSLSSGKPMEGRGKDSTQRKYCWTKCHKTGPVPSGRGYQLSFLSALIAWHNNPLRSSLANCYSPWSEQRVGKVHNLRSSPGPSIRLVIHFQCWRSKLDPSPSRRKTTSRPSWRTAVLAVGRGPSTRHHLQLQCILLPRPHGRPHLSTLPRLQAIPCLLQP